MLLWEKNTNVLSRDGGWPSVHVLVWVCVFVHDHSRIFYGTSFKLPCYLKPVVKESVWFLFWTTAALIFIFPRREKEKKWQWGKKNKITGDKSYEGHYTEMLYLHRLKYLCNWILYILTRTLLKFKPVCSFISWTRMPRHPIIQNIIRYKPYLKVLVSAMHAIAEIFIGLLSLTLCN